MVVLGGWANFMREVPLYDYAEKEVEGQQRFAQGREIALNFVESLHILQGHLAHKQTHPPRTLP